MRQTTVQISDEWIRAAADYGTTPENQISGLETSTLRNALGKRRAIADDKLSKLTATQQDQVLTAYLAAIDTAVKP